MKAARVNQVITYKKSSIELTSNFRNHGGQKAVEWHIESAERKTVNQEFYIQQNSFLKMKEKLTHSEVNENWENLLLVDLPMRNIKMSPSGWYERTLRRTLVSQEEK